MAVETGHLDRLAVSIPSKLQYVLVVRRMVADLARCLEFTDSEVAGLELAADEICTNAIVHGSSGRDDEVDIQVEVNSGELRVVVCDHGLKFVDLKPYLERNPRGDLTARSGRGLFLAKNCVDDIGFDFVPHRGTEVWLLKHKSDTLSS